MDERTNGCSRRAVLGGALRLGGLTALARHGNARAATPTWRLLPGDGPAPRWDHTLAADEAAKRLLLFGGRDASGAALSDTWLYDLAERAWRQVDSSGPSPRFGHAVAVERATRTTLLFGGQAGDKFFNDVWTFDFESESWSLLADGSSSSPSPRYGLGAVLDDDGRLIVSHGFTFEGRFDDSWAFDRASGTWTEITPTAERPRPLKRCLHEQVWDADSGTMLLYGGCSSGFGPCPQGDLWQLDVESSTWTELTPGSGPAPRSNPSLLSDDRPTRLLLFGGSTADGYVNDLWEGRRNVGGFVWARIDAETDGPSPRASHDAVLARGDLYLFGGTGSDGVTADLWKLSLT